jgi:hypothetical protein
VRFLREADTTKWLMLSDLAVRMYEPSGAHELRAPKRETETGREQLKEMSYLILMYYAYNHT